MSYALRMDPDTLVTGTSKNRMLVLGQLTLANFIPLINYLFNIQVPTFQSPRP